MLLAYLQEKDYEAAKADPSEELGSMGSRKFRLMVVCEVSNSTPQKLDFKVPKRKFGSWKPDFGPRSLEFGTWREVCSSGFSLGLPRSAGPSFGSKLQVSKFGSGFPWASRVVQNLAQDLEAQCRSLAKPIS